MLNGIQLTPEQYDRQNEFYRATLKTGVVTTSEAYSLAQMLLQDEMFGLETRTAEQMELARNFAIALSQVGVLQP